MARKLVVAVIFGGRSGEHEVSLNSAESVIANLDKDKYQIIPIKIDKQGQWFIGEESVALLPIPKSGRLWYMQQNRWSEPIDVFMPILHGTFGEDGTIQGLLEMAQVPYVGAGVVASAMGMDKEMMKKAFLAARLPLLKYLAEYRLAWEREPQKLTQKVQEKIGYPCFVKPASLGSSVGISLVSKQEELARAVNLAAKYDRKIIVEASAAPCQEVECSVLGNDLPRASTVGEIVPGNEFYDYRAKYIDDNSELLIPACIDEQTKETIRDMSIKAFQAIDCAGLARVDFFVKANGQVYLNEINTIPGFTKISMYPKLWEASGIRYSELLDSLISLAQEYYQEKFRSVLSYDD